MRRIRRSNDVAHLILGDDIVFPEEIAEACGLSYSDVDLKRFADMLLSEEALRWCKANGYAVMAGPPAPMGLLRVRSLKPDHFLWGEFNRWYERHTFSDEAQAGPEWLAIRKKPVPDSMNRSWHEQLSLLMEDEQVPNTSEMGWFTTTFYEVRGVRLFGQGYVRTSSIDSFGNRVTVGFFDEDGFFLVDCWEDDFRCGKTGIAASRKF